MRVIAVDARGGGVLDWEVPATQVSLTRSLNTSCMIDVTVPASYHARKDSAGDPVLLKYGTILVVEEDNGRLTPALMSSDSLAEDFQAGALGLSTLSKDEPWTRSPQQWVGYDALRAWRFIWNRVIERSGVPRLHITGDETAGVGVGKAASAMWQRVQGQIAQAQVFLDRRDNRVDVWEQRLVQRTLELAKAGGRKTVGEVSTSNGWPATSEGRTNGIHIQTGASGAVRVFYWAWEGIGAGSWTQRSTERVLTAGDRYLATLGSRDRAKELYPTYEQRKNDLENWLEEHHPDAGPEPYELNAWSSRDLSANLEEIRDLGGFDWWETATWDDQDRLVPEIRAVRKAGTVRSGLLFELGVNIHSHPELSRGDIATHVTAMGAGEGESTLMADREWSHRRLVRKSRTVSESSHGTQQLVDRAADRELAKAKAALEFQFTSLVVTDSPGAPIDQIGLGDLIDIRGELSDGSDLEQRVRVMEITRTWDGGNPGTSIEIEVEPA
ncbi:hypothetical protein [Citricoccus sp. NR2]|uniref:hypothetical protein n=1 Tax=Citricoccus sp. NR2 TaxID=3004095 RepID=UPI0022DE603D|nr:hypothetical protein [Citricoccus sp. NR2]WBL18524.1 hypothetical protein O1A05_12255 [Citricoccus sp. NR2]